jgi:uncharacterized protein DUF6338
MSWLSSDILKVLWFLLPGFVAAWTFSGLTRHPKLSEFERVIQSLIFTAFCQVTVILLRTHVLHRPAFTDRDAEAQLLWSLATALPIGVLFALLVNHDAVHWLFRMLRVTRATAYPSEWVRAFHKHGRTFVVLHLSGERRLMGWVHEWPAEPQKGHLSVEQAQWLKGEKAIPLKGVERVLVPASEVTFLEFMERPQPEEQGGEE